MKEVKSMKEKTEKSKWSCHLVKKMSGEKIPSNCIVMLGNADDPENILEYHLEFGENSDDLSRDPIIAIHYNYAELAHDMCDYLNERR